MPTIISIDDNHAVEKSHIGIQVEFLDENGQAVVPSSVTWTLSNEDGATINDRIDVSITAASTVTIVLNSDDLALPAGFTGGSLKRKITVSAVIDSDLGNDLTLKDSITFPVVNLAAIT